MRDFAAVTPGSPNRVRSAPATSSNVISQLYPGTVVKVIEGPMCVDGLVFWKVEHASIPGGSGWTAEGDLAKYYLEPVDRVAYSGYGVSFIMPSEWGCIDEVVSAGSKEVGGTWPEHIEFHFIVYPAQSEWSPVIYIYPIEKLTSSFYGPTVGAPLMVKTHEKTLLLGKRVVSENGNIHPVFNSHLLYYYEGKSMDGKHTIIFVMPVNVPFLPNSYEDPSLPSNGIPFRLEGDFDWSAYYQKVQAQLEAAPETAFTPTLEILDALVESITVGEP